MQVDEGRLEMSLAEIDQLLLPNGYYSKWNDSELNDKLMEWVRKGGKIIAEAKPIELKVKTLIKDKKETKKASKKD